MDKILSNTIKINFKTLMKKKKPIDSNKGVELIQRLKAFNNIVNKLNYFKDKLVFNKLTSGMTSEDVECKLLIGFLFTRRTKSRFNFSITSFN